MPLLRVVISLAVLALLARAGRVAWSRRDLAQDVWRSIRPRHVVGAFGMLVVVIGTTAGLIAVAPVLGHGAGALIGASGNAVFVPVDAAAQATAVGTDGASTVGTAVYILLVTAFLGMLVLLLPWFAFVEEEVFRAGAEAWSVPRRVLGALWFGAAHLVMLVPVAAALAIAVAGGVYGEVYRRGVRRGATAPRSIRAAFHPTRRSEAAVRQLVGVGPGGLEHRHEDRQAAGVHASTVWHTTFNSLVVVLVWVMLVTDATRG